MPDSFDDRFSGLPVDAPTAPLISDIVGNAQINSPQINLVPVDYDPFPKNVRKRGLETFNEEPPTEMIRPDAPLADKAFGLNDKERYQFFPERLARSVYDVMSGQVAPYNPSTGEYNVEGALDVAGLMGGAPLGIKPGTATLGSGAVRPIMNANKNEVAPVFFSAVEKAVTDISQPKMTGQQWLGTLSNKPGVKPEELDWIGLKDYLKENADKVVTKQEIESHVAGNRVELKDINKGKYEPDKLDEKQYHKDLDRVAVKDFGRLYDHLADSEQQQVRQAALERQNQNPTKYAKWQLPGGENYREKLLTLPEKPISTKNWSAERDHNGYENDWLIKNERGETVAVRTGNTAEDALNAATKNLDGQVKNTYKSSHWDEPNVLAHVRMNDRTIEGKKSLHLEEIQSDWHQQGRQQGYKAGPEPVENYIIEGNGPWYIKNKRTNEIEHDFNRKQDAEGYLKDIQKGLILPWRKNDGGVPDAPFKKTWHELALKRMLREAAEKGYDRLSWTPGEAQAARYDLSKQIDGVIAERKKSGNFDVAYKPKGSKGYERLGNEITPVKLAENIGKELADKIINQEKTTAEYSGLDLKVGGEGMKGFYDQIIPKALEKIGKEHGVKVKQGTLPLRTKGGPTSQEIVKDLGYTFDEWKALTNEQRSEALSKSKYAQPIHYIDIPQSLKDQAMHKGFPLFSGGFMLNPVDHNPFEEKK